MAPAAVPSPVVIEWADLKSGKDLTKEVAIAFGEGGLGLCAVKGVPGLEEARTRLLPLAHRLAHLEESVLERYEKPEASYCVGWSRGREKFKGKPDLAKGSFYANPIFDDPANGDEAIREKYPYAASRNVWPEELPELETAFKAMGQLVYDAAKPLVRQCDQLVASKYASHGTRLYDLTFESRMAVARLLHYYPGCEESWCGWHNDNSVITGLVPAVYLDDSTGEEISFVSPEAGLYVKSRTGEIVKISMPKDCLGFQIGEAGQIISGGVLRATPHHVRGHQQAVGEAPVCRETYAFFMEPQWDAEIGPPTGATYDEVIRGEETELIPPLSKRLKLDPATGTVEFGKLLGDSFAEYYAHNNPE